jgi:hypothetical protein
MNSVTANYDESWKEAIIEYYIAPKNNPGHVQVATVTHGYRTANEFIEKAFGSSGSCNMNVNCGGSTSEACVQGEYVELSGGGQSTGADKRTATLH